MPEFYLNDDNATRRYHALSDFAKGFVEAAFFTNGDADSEVDEWRLNNLGVHRLTKAALAAIAADCAAFYDANRDDIEAAQALEPGSEEFRYGRDTLDDRRCGHFFWYALKGHGVGWTDDGDADCLERLQDASRASRERYMTDYNGWIHYD